MIITIWRKRTHNLICGPSSFLAATPPRREHLQLLLKTKNSAWADFSVTKCEKSWKEAVGALLNNAVRLSFLLYHNQGGNTNSTCCASYWGTLGRVEEQERDWKKEISIRSWAKQSLMAIGHACQNWEGQKPESTYVTVRSSLVPVDVEGGWSRAGQVVGGNLLKEKIIFLSLVSKSTCSSMTRPASKRSISEDLFIVPTLILRPPSLRSRYLFADFMEMRNHRNICQELFADELGSNNFIWLLEHCLHSVRSL